LRGASIKERGGPVSWNTDDRMAMLSRVPLFAGCSDASLRKLAEVSGEIQFPAGRWIVQQGQIGNGLYVLIDGKARAVRGDDVLAELGPGDFFGELAVIDQLPRAASVRAETATTCLALASWDLLALLEVDARLGLNLVQELVHRLRSCDEQLHH
jgi:CRP/FNR family cyclic AMP-dependent transcriptional regulator